MALITIWRSNLERARSRCELTPDESALVEKILAPTDTSNLPVEINELPVAMARAMLVDAKLKPNERAMLAVRAHGLRSDDLNHEHAYNLKVNSPLEFGSTMLAMKRGVPNAEMRWNDRWYPVILKADLREDHESKMLRYIYVETTLGMGQCTRELTWAVDPNLFNDERGQPQELTLLQVIERMGFRRVQTKAVDFNLRLTRSERLAADHGKQVWVRASVLEVNPRFWGSGLTDLPLGTADMPRRAIVEPSLEVDEHSHRAWGASDRNLFDDTISRMPLVRVFSLDTKSYVFADIDDLEPYDYDEQALSKLYLPEEMKGVLHRVFETPTHQLFGDLIRGKHGGIVILACGSPGVGKTLTAEVYAEMTQRPLYGLEFGELGTTVDQIERNLESIFARIVRWRAVLQFDECEIFLAQRGGDLERSAIVGIFLRMLDYYEGLLFLTSNRPEVLDDAVCSRVMLRLDYPDLDHAARAQVWQTMFEAAELNLTDGSFAELAEDRVNGRQIRNLVRLARILHPDRDVTRQQVRDLLKYGGEQDGSV